MTRGRSIWDVAISVAILFAVCALMATGCSKSEESGGESGGQIGGGPPGGGQMGGDPGGDRFQMVAATTTSADIYQQKCQGCHGDKGQGARGPSLLKVAKDSNAELRATIHEGHGKMPAFGKQMSAAQLDALVVYVKQLGAGK